MTYRMRAPLALVVVAVFVAPSLAQRAKREDPNAIPKIVQQQLDQRQATHRRLMQQFTNERQTYADNLKKDRGYPRYRQEADALAKLLEPSRGGISQTNINRYFQGMVKLDKENQSMFNRSTQSVRINRRALDQSYTPVYRELGPKAFERRDLMGLTTRYGRYEPQRPIQENNSDVVLTAPFTKPPIDISFYFAAGPFAQSEADQATGEFSVFLAAANRSRYNYLLQGGSVNIPSGTTEMTVTATLELSSAAFAVDVDGELVDDDGNAVPALAASYLVICVFGGASEDDYRFYPQDLTSLPVAEVIVAAPGTESDLVTGEVQITQTISTQNLSTVLSTPIRAGFLSAVEAPGESDANLNIEGRLKEIRVSFD